MRGRAILSGDCAVNAVGHPAGTQNEPSLATKEPLQGQTALDDDPPSEQEGNEKLSEPVFSTSYTKLAKKLWNTQSIHIHPKLMERSTSFAYEKSEVSTPEVCNQQKPERSTIQIPSLPP